jgi:uncharacterized membrane protein
MTTSTPVPVSTPAEPRPSRLTRARKRMLGRWRYSYTGLVGATVFFCLSLTPSLLPRGHVLQGLISGISAAIGYGLGVLVLWVVRMLSNRPLPAPGRVARWSLAGTAVVAVAVFLYLGSGWQRDIHRLMGVDPPPRAGYVVVLVVAVLLAAGLIGLFRLLRKGAGALARLLGRWIPASTARVIAGALVVILALGVLNGVVIDGFFAVTDNSFRAVNGETRPDTAPPTSATRSGGPGSLVSWESLGKQGRVFVTGSPDAAQLRQFSGAVPADPIRVYAGLGSAPTSRERAQLAVRELERTGAFTRRVLCVVTTTGTGWVDEQAIDPLEYMYNGDTAIVGLQYSYLPSWLSFLVDKERAREAGRDLFNAVYGAWVRLPAERRPKLVVFGESLGSFGAESAFSGVDDLRNRVDGMVLVGPPNRNQLWRDLVAARDSGSTEILPRYENGQTVRFAGDPGGGDLDQPASWEAPRIVYLQHPSDPIVWWSPKLIVSRPDWLDEPRGADVLPAVRWLPFVTFWQVTADMAFSTGVPAGHGHSYGTETAEAWTRVLPPDGWTSDRTAALTALTR